jgi:hypothetical protein
MEREVKITGIISNKYLKLNQRFGGEKFLESNFDWLAVVTQKFTLKIFMPFDTLLIL